MEIKKIQEWEKEYARRKGLPPKNKKDAPGSIGVGYLKLCEEVGELAEAVLRKQYNEIPAELADIIIFASKIGKITEDYFGQPSLTEILEKKIQYAEKRDYDKKSRDLTKPESEFK